MRKNTFEIKWIKIDYIILVKIQGIVWTLKRMKNWLEKYLKRVVLQCCFLHWNLKNDIMILVNDIMVLVSKFVKLILSILLIDYDLFSRNKRFMSYVTFKKEICRMTTYIAESNLHLFSHYLNKCNWWYWHIYQKCVLFSYRSYANTIMLLIWLVLHI